MVYRVTCIWPLMGFPKISHTMTCQYRAANERYDFNQLRFDLRHVSTGEQVRGMILISWGLIWDMSVQGSKWEVWSETCQYRRASERYDQLRFDLRHVSTREQVRGRISWGLIWDMSVQGRKWEVWSETCQYRGASERYDQLRFDLRHVSTGEEVRGMISWGLIWDMSVQGSKWEVGSVEVWSECCCSCISLSDFYHCSYIYNWGIIMYKNLST